VTSRREHFIARSLRGQGRSLAAALLAGLLFVPGLGRAEPSVEAQAFQPSPFWQDLFQVGLGETLAPPQWNVGVFLNYQNDPLVLRRIDNDEQLRAVLSDQLTADLLFAYRLEDWLSLGAALPVALYQAGDGYPGGAAPSTAALGDLRLYGRIRLLRVLDDRLALAFEPVLSVPTSTDAFTGRPGFAFLPKLQASFDLTAFGFALDLGYFMTRNEKALDLALNDELRFQLGAWVQVVPETLRVVAELAGSTQAVEPFAAAAQSPLELRLGVAQLLEPGMELNYGLGFGVTQGYSSPDFRLFAGVLWGPVDTTPPDRDGDGIADERDRCPDVPEALDRFEDEDGCADPDNDGDRIMDPWLASSRWAKDFSGQAKGSDKCPSDPEDLDGWEDEDGCPDPDDDGDGVLDPWVSEKGQLERYREQGSGSDRCPRQPEDKDGFADDDGCADEDNDGDGICDPWVASAGVSVAWSEHCRGSDDCPNEPETVNGFEDEDGCPDSAARVEGKAIIILDKVLFEYDKTVILERSYGVLNDVVRVMKENPQILRVRIEGHTDTRGRAAYNLRLSDGRTKAVMQYLVEHGVEAKRLEARGFGASRPLVKPERTEEDYQTNRRVEFHILKQGPAR